MCFPKVEKTEGFFTVQVTKKFFKLRITIRCGGEKISLQEIVPDMGVEGLDEETENILKNRMMPILSENIKLSNRYGVNRITIGVSKQKLNKLALNVIFMILGILLGLICKTILPSNVSNFLAGEILGTFVTAFFNVLKMIVAPLVFFFSIVTGISSVGDAGALGRISVKTVLYFVGFSIVGLLIGLGVYAIFPIGDPEMMKLVDFETGKATATISAWESFKNLILSIFPSNLIGAFVNNEILAVIFLAVIIGLCIGKMQSDFSESLNRMMTSLNELMCKLATMIVSVMPLVILCSMTKMMITVELSSAMILMKLLGIFVLEVLILFCVFTIVMLLNGISPITFYKGFAPAMLSAFTLASSSAVIPISLKCCTENLMIPQMISYFIVPLGATINSLFVFQLLLAW